MPNITAIEPAAIVASENPIVLTLSTASHTTPTNAINTFTVNALLHNNDSVQITLSPDLNNYSLKIWAKDFPNQENYMLTQKVVNVSGSTLISPTTLQQIASSLAQCLQNDLVISKNYYVGSSGSTVTMISKQQSSRFSIGSSQVTILNPSGIPTSTGITHTQVSAGADQYSGSLFSDYTLYADVYTDFFNTYGIGETITTSGFQRITGLELPYSVDNTHKFNFSNICKSLLSIDLPDFTQYSTIDNNYLKPFFFSYGENYALVPGTSTKKKNEKGRTGIKWVLNGALDYSNANKMFDYTGATVSGKIVNTKFLTNSPQIKNTSRSAKEILYVIVPHNLTPSTLSFFADIKFWDGSTSNNNSLHTITASTGGVYMVNASYSKLNLASFETAKKIKQVDFSLRYSGTTKYSQVKSFHYEYSINPDHFGVCFQNKLGTFDTIDFNGLRESTIDRVVSTYSTPLAINTDGSFRTGFKSSANYGTQTTKKIIVDTGWINQATFDWLMELMSSNLIYSYSTEINNYLKLDNFKYDKTNQDGQYNIEVTFIQTLFENNVAV
ncbi:hypothetical protein WSM22_03400 [Cytophagales bacterium WSM2-2]|nr:hypothetical protein WSM22_03400 [Cytophagales bacterium WSM2-2]